MGIGYVAVAAVILLRRPFLDRLAALYAFALILAYVVSRLPIDSPLPIEPIGVMTKVAEAALLVVLVVLIRRPGGRLRARQ